MTSDREVAESLSDGLNALTAIVMVLSQDAPSARRVAPEWPAALQAMERALDAIASGQVRTSLVVNPDDIEVVRRVGVLVSEWAGGAGPPQELGEVAKSVLRRFGLGGSGPDA